MLRVASYAILLFTLLMNDIVNRLLPINSNRRMFLRVLRDVMQAPHTLRSHFNWVNFANLLNYYDHKFDCPVCGNEAKPLYDFPDIRLRQEHRIGILRETLQCRRCFASMRQRSLALGFLSYLNDRRSENSCSIKDVAAVGFGGLTLLDSDAFSAMSMLLRDVPGYVRCSYIPSRPWGTQLEQGYFNIDLQRIDFADESFDIVLTSDVMEHVRNCDAAHAEIYRILKPGGAYIFNVPYDEQAAEDIQLIDTSTDQDIFLCKPQLHGDPLTGGVVAYRVFGRSLLGKLEELGFKVEFRRIQQPSALVVDGDVFVARKHR